MDFTKHIFMNSNKIYVVCLQIVKFNLYCVLIYNNMTFLCTTLCCQSETWQVGTRVSRISWNFSKSSGKKISHSIYQKKDMCKFLEFSEIIYYPPGALTFSVIWLQVVATINVTKWPYLRPEVPNPKKNHFLLFNF